MTAASADTTGKKSILVAEDDQALGHALRLKLEHEGFTVDVATDGQQCLDMNSKKKYDVILLDLIMPGVDGFQTLEELRRLPQRPKVMVLSNLGQAEDKDRALLLGALSFFTKSNTALNVIVDEVKKL